MDWIELAEVAVEWWGVVTATGLAGYLVWRLLRRRRRARQGSAAPTNPGV